jgi:hypothetical protein
MVIDKASFHLINAEAILEGDFEVMAKVETINAWVDLCELDGLKTGHDITLYHKARANTSPITFKVTLPPLR